MSSVTWKDVVDLDEIYLRNARKSPASNTAYLTLRSSHCRSTCRLANITPNFLFLTSVGVEPTNAACAPSTARSDVLNHYTIEASPKKDAQVAYITTPDAAVHSVYGFYINYFSVQNYVISLICSSDTCLFRPQWRHNPYKYFDFCGGRTHECGVRA